MSAGDQAAAAILTQVALAADGAVLGVALAYVAVRSFIRFAATSSALRRISDAPSVRVSDLRSLISDEADAGGERLVLVRGTVESKSAVNGSWKSLWNDVLVSHDSGERAVVIQRSQKVPFVLVEGLQQPQSDYVVVDLDGSNHPLPLTIVFHKMQPIQATPYSFLQALFGHEYPVGLLDEEKILALGKNVTAVGICSSKDGVPVIKSCRDLPCFLSEMTKDQMVLELSSKAKILLWSGIIVGSVSIGILGYAILRNWNKWKEWRERRRAQQEIAAAAAAAAATAGDNLELEVIEDEEVGDVPDGQLCVICLMRRRRAAFVPCGHLVCCQRCALFVERDLAPKCPVCRQAIRTSVRIYDS
ncbi:hypothetical protein Cgig2_025175 [Carnegiea gigantea]|uniref:RING-type E3 ubiquitin transferase n=1 Tax=Carnegiea gigantea TaxID=171969 RepID=A0A9Q1KSY4_9CARY|nr:hypothetical protein Cgig2_025175 [Carnegiea gigantea]